MSETEVHGHIDLVKSRFAFIQRATFDLSVCATLYFLWVGLGFSMPLPTFFSLVLFALSASLLYAAFFWKMKVAPSTWVESHRLFNVLFATPIILASLEFIFIIAPHPTIFPLSVEKLPSFAPGTEASSRDWAENWQILPFYFTFAAWPKNFQGSPILYQLPYAKNGPPNQFVSQIIARWKMPHITWTIEGPKTATKGVNFQSLKDCFRSESSIRCSKIKTRFLSRHLQELKLDQTPFTQARWFEVSSALQGSQVPLDEKAQGVYLFGENANSVQERYVVINKEGAQQTFTLRRSKDADGEYATLLAKQTIGSLQITNELTSGKQMVNRNLALTRLEALQKIEDTAQFVQKISEIQLQLLSKISVEPKSFDAYFHLAGTAHLLGKHADLIRTRRSTLLPLDLAQKLEEWSAVVKPLIHSSYQYAKDVEPLNPHIEELERLWISAQKSF